MSLRRVVPVLSSIVIGLVQATACTPADSGGDTGFGSGVGSGVTSDPTLSTGVTSDTTTADTSSSVSGDGDGDASGDGDGDVTGDGDGDDAADASMAFCGDSIVEGFESCDCGSDGECTLPELDNKGCEDVLHEESGNNYDGGVLTCNLSCQFDATGCYVCGDGVKEDSEPCDGTEFGNASCGSEGFLGGTIACTPDCQLDTSMCSMAAWADDFETGDFSAASYTFAGTGQWSVGTGQSVSGVNSASSATITSNQSTELALSINFATAGTIAFNHRESCESTFDNLIFYIDTVQQEQWNGNNDWAEASYAVTAGTHQMRWVYSKDGSVDSLDDKVWVDDIRTDGIPQ
jgi:hypothetical protein